MGPLAMVQAAGALRKAASMYGAELAALAEILGAAGEIGARRPAPIFRPLFAAAASSRRLPAALLEALAAVLSGGNPAGGGGLERLGLMGLPSALVPAEERAAHRATVAQILHGEPGARERVGRNIEAAAAELARRRELGAGGLAGALLSYLVDGGAAEAEARRLAAEIIGTAAAYVAAEARPNAAEG